MPRLLALLVLVLLIGGCGGTYYRISKDLGTGRRVRVGESDYLQEKVSRSTVFAHQVDNALYKGQERDEQRMLR